jgi:hypothetical protein
MQAYAPRNRIKAGTTARMAALVVGLIAPAAIATVTIAPAIIASTALAQDGPRVSAAGSAKVLDGIYAVKGRDVGRETYEGIAEIRRSGQTYQMVWKIGPTGFVGTGLYAEGVLSVAFRDMQGRVLGLGVYALQEDKTLAGVFTFVGSDKTGSEMLSPMTGDALATPPRLER